MRQRPALDPLRRAFRSGDWALLVFQKRGDRDAFLIFLLTVYGIYFYDPYPPWLPAWRVLDLGYFVASVAGITFSISGWLLAPGFMRARAIMSMQVDQVPWYRCWVHPRFLLALVLLYLIGLAFMLLALWVLLDMAGRYGLNTNAVYETLYALYALLGVAGGLVTPAV